MIRLAGIASAFQKPLKEQEEVDNIIIETDLKTEEKKIINVHN